MKMNKIMMLAMAGVAFAACSNENEVSNPAPEGVGAVSIRIVSPYDLTRAVAPSDGSTIKVVPADNSNVEITLDADDGGGTITISKTDWEASSFSSKMVTFYNVKGPKSVTVKMNGGLADYSSTSITSASPVMQAVPANIPVYGSTNSFTLASGTKDGIDSNTAYTLGAENGDSEVDFPYYTATVTLEIPVARLEVGSLKLADASVSGFSTLTMKGVYLDNILPTKGGTRTDYCYETGAGTGTAPALLTEAVNGSEGSSFLSGTFPADNNVYAFNFYGVDPDEASSATASTVNPKFKIYFNNVVAASGQTALAPKGYAIIENYYASTDAQKTTPLVLQNGKVYKIIGAELTGDNITSQEDGTNVYAIDVTVVEANWSVETINASWAGDNAGE